MIQKKLLFSLIIFLVIFISGCIGGNPKILDDRDATPESVNAVVDANNQFALDLYSKYKFDDGNIFFSPYSISAAMVMTYEGARGKTSDEIQSVFHYPKDIDVRRPAFADIYNEVNKGDKDCRLITSNALWAQNNYSFDIGYFDIIKTYYGGEVIDQDFKTEPEKSRLTINDWVAEQTENKIKDLIPEGIINSDTRLVLTNAIYFKGNWDLQFDEKNTVETDFFENSEKTVKAQMMSLTGADAKFNYAETDDLQILELPYVGNDLSMLVLLPKANNISIIDNILSTDKLLSLKSDLYTQRVDVYLPKFKFETKYLMSKDLIEMGMPTAFSDYANFTGMLEQNDSNIYEGLKIREVIHQAFVEVNEEGTEAAAATAVVMDKSVSMRLPRIATFRADHPFIFLIQDKTTGTILFLGRVSNPDQF
ncbi:MAG: serpin family protein [Nanohaloarchaea archaeon]|nr:serpin family protein [Candidatus Nanohaloarchaea archaeon]